MVRGCKHGAGELLLRADDISYSQGKRLILDRVSFELRRAQITTIIGPNGAGKSTLTNIVNGLINNYSGRSSAVRDCASVTCRKKCTSTP